MSDWISLIKELIWPLFIGVIILWNRQLFKELLNAIRERVKDGSEFNIGPSGVSVGQAPVLPDTVSQDDIIDDGYLPDNNSLDLPTNTESKSIESQYSLSHHTSFWKIKNGRPYYRIFITTHAETKSAKSKIEKVVYHLHPTFKNPTRVVSTSENDFLLKTNGWGEFVIKAEVYLSNSSTPIKLSRYIDLKA